MAQSEDTELRDLVIEALEKNGSLAKIRALLRANVFLAFEDECEKKHNTCLDSVLKLPEGIISLSIVHEFLEFCNLKNTLFVYMAETRQGKEYTYEGQKHLAEKFNCYKRDHTKEPLLVSIVKNLSKSTHKRLYEQSDNLAAHKDEQNCTYIVHEDTSSASSPSNSHSDQSLDEKNKLHLRLPLDNSDTDTSTDSARDKTSSEYIPNENIVIKDESDDDNKSNVSQQSNNDSGDKINHKPNLSEKGPTKLNCKGTNILSPHMQMQLGDLAGNNSNESTSYLDFKPFGSFAEKLLNTSGLPTNDSQHHGLSLNQTKQWNKITEDRVLSPTNIHNTQKIDPESPATLSNVTTISSKTANRVSQEEALRTETNTPDYSYDFSTSSPSKNKEKLVEEQQKSPDFVQMTLNDGSEKVKADSPHQNSQSSQSSVSISDVADLIELSEGPKNNTEHEKDHKSSDFQDNSKSANSRLKEDGESKMPSEECGDFSESPVPSLSNLSVDFHDDD